MKRGSSYLVIIVALLIASNLSHAENTSNPGDIVIQYFEAAQTGDVETMKQLIAGSFYNRRKVLLEENEGYPNFLIEHYEGTKVQLSNVVIKKDNMVAVVGVKLLFADGGVDTTKLLLKRDTGGTWKIVEEMNP